MGILLDLLGALMIATLLLLMMISFQFQLRDTADRTIFAAQMMNHEQRASQELNHLIALAGINMPTNASVATDLTVMIADPTNFKFRTYWDFKNNVMTGVVNTIDLKLSTTETDVGRELTILQSSSPVYDLGSILWLENLQFTYYDITGAVVAAPMTTAKLNSIMSVDVGMTFKRYAPTVGKTPLRTSVQVRVYFMNRYLKKGA
jgi:hypothetical protein